MCQSMAVVASIKMGENGEDAEKKVNRDDGVLRKTMQGQ